MANVYLNEDNVDDLGRMVLALLSEFWVMRDRMAVMEALLVKAKIFGPDDIEQFSYTAEQEQQIEALRDRIVAAVVGAPVAARERTLNQIMERAGFKAQPKMEKV
jgi:nitrogen regulatory protein PII-like uncharacterized protein